MAYRVIGWAYSPGETKSYEVGWFKFWISAVVKSVLWTLNAPKGWVRRTNIDRIPR